MQFLRKAALTAAASLFTLSLFSVGLSCSVYQTLGHAGPVKQALDASGIYSSVVGDVLQQSQNNQTAANTSDVPVSQPAVQAIIKQSFPADFLQAQTESVIDAAYNWLDGSQNSLQFNIDLTGAKTKLADGIGQYAHDRLSSLPACAPNAIPSGDIDAFTATCVPTGFDTTAAAAKARDQILNGDFLKNANVNQNTLKVNNGRTVAQQLHAAPAKYRQVRQAILLDGAVAAALAAAVIFLSTTWRVGVRKVSVIAITVGAVSAIFAALSSFITHKLVQRLSTLHASNTSLQQHMGLIVQRLVDDMRTHWLTYGIVLALLGVAALVVLRLLQPKNAIDIRPKKLSKYVGEQPALTGEMPISAAEKQVRRSDGAGGPPKTRSRVQ